MHEVVLATPPCHVPGCRSRAQDSAPVLDRSGSPLTLTRRARAPRWRSPRLPLPVCEVDGRVARGIDRRAHRRLDRGDLCDPEPVGNLGREQAFVTRHGRVRNGLPTDRIDTKPNREDGMRVAGRGIGWLMTVRPAHEDDVQLPRRGRPWRRRRIVHAAYDEEYRHRQEPDAHEIDHTGAGGWPT